MLTIAGGILGAIVLAYLIPAVLALAIIGGALWLAATHLTTIAAIAISTVGIAALLKIPLRPSPLLSNRAGDHGRAEYI